MKKSPYREKIDMTISRPHDDLGWDSIFDAVPAKNSVSVFSFSSRYYNKYFFLWILTEKKFQRNHPRGKNSKNDFRENIFWSKK